MQNHRVNVLIFFLLENPLDDISDSETEDLSEIRIDDWLVFEMDREVGPKGTLLPILTFYLLESFVIFPI